MSPGWSIRCFAYRSLERRPYVSSVVKAAPSSSNATTFDDSIQNSSKPPCAAVGLEHTRANVMSHSGILIMISYEIDIGFAIGRLIRAFYEMGVRVTGDTRRMHFSFGHIGGGRCASLPASFENLLEFDYRNPTDASLTRFGDYIERNRIGVIFGLDLPVQAKCLAV